MTQLQLAEEELSDSVRLEHGSISIGASETALNIYLLEHLKKFHIAYPGVRLKICNHSTPQAIRSVRSGEIDFAVVTTPTQLDAPLRVKTKIFSGNFNRRENVYLPCHSKIFPERPDKISFYLSWLRNSHLSFLL